MTHTGEAREEVKKTSMLKAEKEAGELLEYNDSQVRDSTNLNSKHAWQPDNFLPSSIIDQLGYQEDRQLMTQQEYIKSRAQDAEILMKKRLLWSGHEHRLDEMEHQKLFNREEAIQILQEGDQRTFTELMKSIDVTKEEIDAAKDHKEQLELRTFMHQELELQAKAEAVEKRQQDLSAEENVLESELEKDFAAYAEQLQKEEEVKSDEINTSDVEGVTTTDVETANLYERQFAKLSEDVELSSCDPSDVERQLMQGEEIPDQWQQVSRKEVDELKENLKETPAQVTDILEGIANLEAETALQKKMERTTGGFSAEETTSPEESGTEKSDAEIDRKMLFFEEQQEYMQFAKQIMRENTKEMSAEEKESLLEIQQLIIEHDQTQVTDSDVQDLHLWRKSDFSKKNPHDIELLEKQADIFLNSRSDESDQMMPNLDLETAVKQARGQYEGTRRFERVDRVSLDSEKDHFDKLKLKLRNERVYDEEAMSKATQNGLVMEEAADMAEYAKDGIKLVRREDIEMTTATSGASEGEDRTMSEQESQLEENEVAFIRGANSGSETEVEADGQKIEQLEEPPELAGLNEKERAQVDATAKMLESQSKQLENKEGLVDRPIYKEDWIHRDKAAEMITQEPYDNYLDALHASGMQEKLEAQYEEARGIENNINKNRIKLAKRLNEARKKLDFITNGHETLRKKLIKSNAANYEHQIAPEINEKLANVNITAETETPAFNGKYATVSDYEKELAAVSKLGLHKKANERDDLLRQFEFLFDSMKYHRIQLTPNIRGQIFQYLVVRNDFALANNQLQFLTKDLTEAESPIDPQYLTFYLRHCLKNDQIDGVAYLTNYFQRYNVDTSSMPIHKFHSMLNYYLNHNFDLSKVMIFCKFYRQFYQDTIRKELAQVITENQKPGTLDDLQLQLLHKRVFAKHDSLIDMRALSKFIVRKTGNKQIIDPMTREDSIFGLIELFTQSPDVYEASARSKNNHIDPETISEYFGSRLNYPNSLDQVMKVAFRLDGTKAGQEFSQAMLERIKSYQTQKNGSLPASFSEQSLLSLYHKAISADKEGKQLTTSSELLLYLMQQKSMHLEVVDFCERKPQLAMAKYYLTESLMKVKTSKKGAYQEAVSQVFGTEHSHMRLAQRTKAIMLDESPQAAYQFFQTEFAQLEEHALKKKAFLVSLYDTLMPRDSGEVSFEEFQEKYVQSQKLAARFAKESFVVNKLERILRDKNYDQIENVVNLYAVMREERLLSKNDYLLDENRNLIEVQERHSQQLQAVMRRKAQLEKIVGMDDTNAIKSIDRVMKDKPLEVFGQAGGANIEKVAASVFSDITEEEAASIEERQQQLVTADNQINRPQMYRILQSKGHGRYEIDKYFKMLNMETSLLQHQYDKLAKDNEDFENGIWKEDKTKAKSEQANEEEHLSDEERIAKKVRKRHYLSGSSDDEQESDDSRLPPALHSKFLQKNPQFKKYLTLSEKEKDRFASLQQDFKQSIKSAVEKRVNHADFIKLQRKVERNEQNLSDDTPLGQVTPKPARNFDTSSDGITDSEEQLMKIEMETEYLADARQHTRHQDQYIAGLQKQYPDLDVRDIIERNTDETSELDKEDCQRDPYVGLIPEMDEAAKRWRAEQENRSLSSTDTELSPVQSNDSEEYQEFDLADKKGIEKATRRGSDTEEEEMFQMTDEFMKQKGFMSADGQIDPIIRAALDQAVIEYNRELRFKKLTSPGKAYISDSDEGVDGFSEELSERGIEEKELERAEIRDEIEDAKGRVTSIFAHQISDLSEIEEATDARNVMQDLWQTIDAHMDLYIDTYKQELITPRIHEDFLDRDVVQQLSTLQRFKDYDKGVGLHTAPNNLTAKSDFIKKMENYRDDLLYSPLTVPEEGADPAAYKEALHDQTVYSMKEELLMAVNKRKYEALPVLIKLFNSIQSKKIGDSFRLEDFEGKNVNDYSILEENGRMGLKVNNIQVDDMGTTIQKLNLLLNDSRSPIFSSLLDTQKYKSSKLPEDPNDHYHDPEAWVRESVDISSYQKDLDKLTLMQYELDRIDQTVDLVKGQVQTSIVNVDQELDNLKAVKRQKEQEEAQEKNQARLRLLHNDYNARNITEDQNSLNEHKVRVMRDILALELGQSFDVNSESDKTATQFPVFYALDLINFGIQQNQPAAIRLGEKLLSESVATKDAKLPQDLAMSMKNYMLDFRNNQGYRDAMKITGPLNSSKLYHMANQHSAAEGITYCLDDPYWQDFIMKNRRREDQWRNPSVIAYKYKQYGMLGEIMDMHALQKKYDQLFNKPL